MFKRLMAWFVLTMWWSVLRFDDTCWLSPGSCCWQEGYWSGWLSRTKTTGKEKRIEGLAALVSSEAWLVYTEWLAIGHELWVEHAPYTRDFFLVLADADLGGTKNAQATYGDALAMARCLWAEISCDEAALFWTMHSMRRGLPAAAAACGAPDEWVGLLGAWAPTHSQMYSVQRAERVLQMQKVVAGRLRGARGKHDMLGEYALLDALRTHLMAKEVSAEVADEIVGGLTYFGVNITPPRAPSGMPWENSMEASGSSIAKEPADSTVEEPDTKKLKMEAIQPSVPEEAKGYVVSISRRHGRRCLHFVGRCPRIPYLHYKEAEELGMEPPPSHAYNLVCKDCWPTKVSKEVAEEGGEGDSIGEAEADSVNSAEESSSDEEDELMAPL